MRALPRVLWYNLTAMKKNTNNYITPYQLKMPLEITKMIDFSDPVYTFSSVMDHIDLSEYFAEKDCKTGRPKCDSEKLLKIILFAFMENGYCSLRQMSKLCRTDIRYMWLLDEMPAPSHMTFENFIRNELTGTIEEIFEKVNSYIFEQENVDLDHLYIDGTKIEANANKYTWVWKKSCLKNRIKVFEKISSWIEQANEELYLLSVKIESRSEYAIEYVEQILSTYMQAFQLDPCKFVSGTGRRKSVQQRRYQELEGYLERLKNYANRIEICGESRNSYSKTDQDATFMRVKRDYMGNDQLLPAYNMQIGVCDEYIAVIDVFQYASDMDCFVPLMKKFKQQYGHYPKYPVADAGYGSYNNYIFCEKNGLQKYMKFPMYEKQIHDAAYRDDPFRILNFKVDDTGNLICPNGKKFLFKCNLHIKGNKYGRTQELYECEDCSGCPYKERCCKSKNENRKAVLNYELTAMHNEVVNNLRSTHGALLRMNRSIQAEGAFGCLKWNYSYKRAYRRGLDNILLEFSMVAIGFNLRKLYNKRMFLQAA